MKFKKGQIYFWFGKKGIGAKAIRFYNWRFFGNANLPTHVGQIVKVEKDKVWIAEALNAGLVIKKDYTKEWLDIVIDEGKVEIGKVKPRLTKVLETAQKYEGTPYGWINCVMHALSIILKLCINKNLKFTDEEKKLHCSEFVVRALYDQSNKKIDFEKEYEVPFDMISPAHIYLSNQVEILDG